MNQIFLRSPCINSSYFFYYFRNVRGLSRFLPLRGFLLAAVVITQLLRRRDEVIKTNSSVWKSNLAGGCGRIWNQIMWAGRVIAEKYLCLIVDLQPMDLCLIFEALHRYHILLLTVITVVVVETQSCKPGTCRLILDHDMQWDRYSPSQSISVSQLTCTIKCV